jgi:osmotically inducible protein OsmC
MGRRNKSPHRGWKKMPTRRSKAVWQGTLKDGGGTMSLASGLFEGPFTFSSRFEQAEGTNPEELVGAAHAGCFSMFLSGLITDKGYKPERISTTAAVPLGPGPTIDRIELETEAVVPGLSQQEFQELATRAKAGCPVSKALAAVPEIVLNATLAG